MCCGRVVLRPDRTKRCSGAVDNPNPTMSPKIILSQCNSAMIQVTGHIERSYRFDVMRRSIDLRLERPRDDAANSSKEEGKLEMKLTHHLYMHECRACLKEIDSSLTCNGPCIVRRRNACMLPKNAST